MEVSPSAVRIAIFASGAGSNTRKIIDYFKVRDDSAKGKKPVRVALIVSNKAGAGVNDIARAEKIPLLLLDKEKFLRQNGYADELRVQKIDLIVLAGFLWKIPSTLIHAFEGRIINIHPALLPKFGGRGMYGMHVHQAVIQAREKESGISIHYVDEVYDHGKVIFQARCPVDPSDSPQTLAEKIHVLEHLHYPKVIEELIDVQNIVKR